MTSVDGLIQFISETLGITDLTEESAMGKNRKWDSLGHVSLILSLDAEYSCGIPPDMIGELVSVGSIVEYFRENDLLHEVVS
jgi:acyl carrier protein